MSGLFLVRISIVFIFLVFGAWEVLSPVYWAPFVPDIVGAVVDPLLATRVHGVVLFVLGVLLLSGFKRGLIAALSAFTLFSVVVSVFMFSGFSDLLVRDIVIFLCSLSLLFEKKE